MSVDREQVRRDEAVRRVVDVMVRRNCPATVHIHGCFRDQAQEQR